jgi:hypothetical protein
VIGHPVPVLRLRQATRFFEPATDVGAYLGACRAPHLGASERVGHGKEGEKSPI